MMQKTKTIGEMCAEFDVTPRTLRFYEDKKLISPLRLGQKRLYQKREIARLKLILTGKRFGLALEEIRELLDMYDLGDQQETQLKAALVVGDKHLKNLKSRQTELNQSIRDLENFMTYCRNRLDEFAHEEIKD